MPVRWLRVREVFMTTTLEEPIAAATPEGTVTVTSMARDWARRTPSQVAMREKDFGIWQDYTCLLYTSDAADE